MDRKIDTTARQRWSTSVVEQRHALAYWVETVCRSFLEIDIDSPERDRFCAQLDQLDFGPAKLYFVEAGLQKVHRTPARIARSNESYYVLLQLLQGQAAFRQCGRECPIQPGDCLLVDDKQPYLLDCSRATRTVAIRFKQDWLHNWVPSPARLIARPIRANGGWSAALAAGLSSLQTAADEPMALPPGVVAEQVAGLLALAAGPEIRITRASEKLLARLRQSIRDRGLDPGLTPLALAEMHGISRRYLHHLFANADTTFGSELIRMRLESARRLLSDRRFADLAVGEIAARCGFSDPSHFARRFRRSFGIPPTAFRVRRQPEER